MTTPTATLDQLRQALADSGALIAAVGDDQWSALTPCGWTVRELVNHVVGGTRLFTALLRGQTPPDRAADHIGDDPAAAHRGAGVDLLDAFTQPGVFDAGRVYQPPFGPAPAAVLLHLRITEYLVHGWDLATATGQPAALPAELAEQELAFSRAVLGDAPRTDRGPFGPAHTVAPDAPAIDRLAGYLGRAIPATARPAAAHTIATS